MSGPQLRPSQNKHLSDIDVQLLKHLLSSYHVQNRLKLIAGLEHGFRIYADITIPNINLIPNNHRSALQHKDEVDKKLQKEILLKHISGPHHQPPLQDMYFSPIGLRPKKEPGEFRLIHDLSHPKGLGVNDFIPKEHSAVTYQTFDDFCNVLLSLPKGALMAKADIKSAFRILPIHPSDYNLLGFTWCGKYYYDKRMPMGASSSCQSFELLSTAVQWILQQYGVTHVTHILDDFMFLGLPGTDQCKASLSFFISLMQHLNIPINPDKTWPPSTTIIVYGIQVDSNTRIASLPQDKLQSARNQLLRLQQKRSTTLRDLQSTIGFLNFACRVVVPGRAFLRRLINLTIGIKQPHHYVPINAQARSDIKTWLQFLQQYNGTSLLLDWKWNTSQRLELATDSAKSKGFGLVFGRKWAYGAWENNIDHNITLLELYPIVLALYLWGSQLANQCVLFYSDNEAVVVILNKQSSKDPTIMKLVRHFVILCLKYNIMCRLKHIPGVLNIVPDLLSRLQVEKARAAAPQLVPTPEAIPPPWTLSRLLEED